MLKEADIARLFQTVARTERVRLMEVKVNRNARPTQIMLTVDLEDRFIPVETCAIVSRQMQDLLDMLDDAPNEYRLTVSSPGIDWPLTEEWQFRKNVGSHIRCRNKNGIVEGRIVSVTGGTVLLELDKGRLSATVAELSGAKLFLPGPRSPKTKRMKNENRNS